MSKSCILHISDLHISSFKDKSSLKEISSRIDNSKHFIDTFVYDLKEFLDKNDTQLKKIVISGDLANQGKKSEYDKVLELQNKIISEFKLLNTDYIIVPGNHDIIWSNNEAQYEENSARGHICNPYELHNEKFLYFSRYYNEFFKRDFNPLKPHIEPITIEKANIVFICLNSSFKESFRKEDHIGYIDLESLNQMKKQLLNDYADYYKIAIMHHNPLMEKINEKSIENWREIKNTLNDLGIYTFFAGHAHTDDSIEVKSSEHSFYLTAGSFAKKDADLTNTYNLLTYNQITEDSLEFILTRVSFKPDISKGQYGEGCWSFEINGTYNNVVKVFKKRIEVKKEIKPEECTKEKAKTILAFRTEHVSDHSFNTQLNKSEFALKLIEIIKENKLFISGHFHWSEASRSRGWIDTNLLLSEDKYLDIIGKALLCLLKEKNISFNYIIGLGMEGNLLGSILSVITNCPYTYIPILNRKDYNEYERRINIAVPEKILFFIDVLSTGNTISSLLDSEEYGFLKNCIEISIVCLFLTGNRDSLNQLFGKYNNVKYYGICEDIEVNYCNRDIKDCPVYNYNLEPVFELFSRE